MWQESKLLWQAATTTRIYNALQVFYSYNKAKRNKKYDVAAYPLAISIEPTTACNLRCPFCISGKRDFTRPTGFLDYELFQKIIDEVHRHTLWLNYYFQGEPFLHPQAYDMIAYAQRKGMIISTSTNAHYFKPENAVQLVDSGLHRMIISIDGASQNTYETYRVGGDLEKVLEGTKNIIEAKKRKKSAFPIVIWQCVVFKHNMQDVQKLKKMAKQVGVDKVVFKTAQIDGADDENWLPDKPLWRRYTDQLNPAHNVFRTCWRMWHSAVITWDGKVVPCCFDKDALHIMGDLNKKRFEDIWKNDYYNNFRKTLFKGRKHIDICTSCTEGSKIWIDA